MCVIAVARTDRMTEEHVKKMFSANRDGAGIAYREHGRVQWRKGLDEEEMLDLIKTVPLPYVAHFRIASCGGIRPELTHPFPISKEVPLGLKGSTSGYVLFHNGHYGRWRDTMMTMATGNALKVPSGPWSDSRLMAWVAAHCTINILPHFDEKLVAFGLEEIEIYGSGWSKVDNLFVSNQSWEFRHTHTHSQNITICRFGSCKKDRVNNTVWCEDHYGGIEKSILSREKDEERAALSGRVQGVAPIPRNFRGGHSDAGAGNSQQAQVEGLAQSVGEGGAQGGIDDGEEAEGASAAHPSLEAGNRMINWVRRLNPKKTSSSIGARLPLETGTDLQEMWD